MYEIIFIKKKVDNPNGKGYTIKDYEMVQPNIPNDKLAYALRSKLIKEKPEQYSKKSLIVRLKKAQ